MTTHTRIDAEIARLQEEIRLCQESYAEVSHALVGNPDDAELHATATSIESDIEHRERQIKRLNAARGPAELLDREALAEAARQVRAAELDEIRELAKANEVDAALVDELARQLGALTDRLCGRERRIKQFCFKYRVAESAYGFDGSSAGAAIASYLERHCENYKQLHYVSVMGPMGGNYCAKQMAERASERLGNALENVR